MKTEEEIMAQVYYAGKQAEEMEKYGNWVGVMRWTIYVNALEWVLQEDNQ